MVVCAVLVIMAGVLMPNIAAIKRSRQIFEAQTTVGRAPLEARNEAVRSELPVEMKVEGTALVLSRVTKEKDEQEFKRVDLGSDLRIESAQLNGNASDLGSWKWTVYPDGSSDSGGLQFAVGNAREGLQLSRDGDGKWVQGDLPAATDSTWTAGELQPIGPSGAQPNG